MASVGSCSRRQNVEEESWLIRAAPPQGNQGRPLPSNTTGATEVRLGPFVTWPVGQKGIMADRYAFPVLPLQLACGYCYCAFHSSLATIDIVKALYNKTEATKQGKDRD